MFGSEALPFEVGLSTHPRHLKTHDELVRELNKRYCWIILGMSICFSGIDHIHEDSPAGLGRGGNGGDGYAENI